LPEPEQSNESDASEEESDETDSEELPLAEQDQLVPLQPGASGKELESQIATYIERNGPSFPGQIATALGESAIKVGRIVAASKRLAKEHPDRNSSRVIRVSRM
jgi:hypothetical protein